MNKKFLINSPNFLLYLALFVFVFFFASTSVTTVLYIQ